MSSEQIVARILGEGSLNDVTDAFCGIHGGNRAYRWDCDVSLHGEVITIDGQIYCHESVVGEFKRRLCFQKGERRAEHVKLEIERAHQDRDIAKHHYRKILRFYKHSAIRFVYLDADVDGPAVWPQFAFDLRLRKDKELLARIMRDHKIENVPKAAEKIFAPDVVAIVDDDDPPQIEPLGIRLLKELRVKADRPLPMFLDLENTYQWTLLVESGIMSVEEQNDA